MHWVGAKGVKLEAHASIDTLRRAAKRGDWALFLAWPICVSCWGLAPFFLSAAAAVYYPNDKVLLYFGSFSLLLPLLAVFMAWAALFTNIDLDVDDLED
jgi:hypothetical protein